MKTIIEIKNYHGDWEVDVTHSILVHENELNVTDLNEEFLNSLNDEGATLTGGNFENLDDDYGTTYEYIKFLKSKGFTPLKSKVVSLYNKYSSR